MPITESIVKQAALRGALRVPATEKLVEATV
jgi:hypothetical protein